MKRSWLIVLLVSISVCALPAGAATRDLTESVPVADIERVVLDTGVGDVELIATSGDTIDIDIVLKPRKGGIFSSMKRAQREVDEATFEMEHSGGELRLRVATDAEERHFEESWTVRMPDYLAIELDMGVGDLEIRGFSGGVRVDSGVGDALIQVTRGDVILDMGVGDVTIQAPEVEYGSVEVASGVGDARLRVAGEKVASEGFVGHSSEWRGSGPSRISADIGVGEVKVELD